ncbi:hypothetical protein EB159_00780, partial [archaeon]|nr:hypothetical protein [archaeon]
CGREKPEPQLRRQPFETDVPECPRWHGFAHERKRRARHLRAKGLYAKSSRKGAEVHRVKGPACH